VPSRRLPWLDEIDKNGDEHALKVALYARVSTADKDQNPETQLCILREYATNHSWEIYKEYVDYASGGFLFRPALDQLMKDASAHRFSAVLVLRIDRFGRSLLNFLLLLKELDKHGIRFLTSDGIDTSDPQKRFLMHVLGAAAEFERELISQRTKEGLARLKKEGAQLGRPRVEVDEQQVKQYRAQGYGYRKIGNILGVDYQVIYRLCKRFEKDISNNIPNPNENMTASKTPVFETRKEGDE